METKTKTEEAKATMAMKKLACFVYLQNLLMNAAKRAYEKSRSELLAMMREAAVTSFLFTGTVKGVGKVTLQAEVATPEVSYIDVRKLKDLVSPEQFLAIVTAAKKSVEESVGKGVATQCEAKKAGTENVSVGVAKL